MGGIQFVHAANASRSANHPVNGHRFEGGAMARQVSPQDMSLWLVVADLDRGTALSLPPTHGDEAVFVRSGSVDVDGRMCPANGAVVIESGAQPVIVAAEQTRVVHLGPRDPEVPSEGLNGPIDRPADTVHVVGPGGTYATVEPGRRDTHFYADSTCPTCRLTLLYTSRMQEYVSETHSHSADELIHLLSGRLQFGSHVLHPGDTVAIDADRRYAFRSGADGFAFINYRRDASEQTLARGSAPRMEGGLAHGLAPVMDLR